MAKFEEVEVTPEDKEHLLPHFYANSFVMGISNADFNLTLMCNGASQARVNISYTTLKTLAVALSEAVNHLESVTGQQIMTIDMVADAMSKASEATE